MTTMCMRCDVKEINDSKETKESTESNQLCAACVEWWREESELPDNIASEEMERYWECDECHDVFVQMIVMYCSSCNMKYCETCNTYMTETGFVECGADTEEYMCPMCFTDGIDRGLIGADFKGMTIKGMVRVQETEKEMKK